jgi:hypothetical protein
MAGRNGAVRPYNKDGNPMNQLQQDTQALAALFACLALQIMGERACVPPGEILHIVDADPEGATAEYFHNLDRKRTVQVISANRVD